MNFSVFNEKNPGLVYFGRLIIIYTIACVLIVFRNFGVRWITLLVKNNGKKHHPVHFETPTNN